MWTRQCVYACETTSAMMTIAIRRFRSGGNEASGGLSWKVLAGTALRIRPAALIGGENETAAIILREIERFFFTSHV